VYCILRVRAHKRLAAQADDGLFRCAVDVVGKALAVQGDHGIDALVLTGGSPVGGVTVTSPTVKMPECILASAPPLV
jgi:hypothetical protein